MMAMPPRDFMILIETVELIARKKASEIAKKNLWGQEQES
jgi:hypothetical protein